MSKVYIESLEGLAEELNQGNVLLVGAPSIGKTYELFEVFKKDMDTLFICDQRIQPSKREGTYAKILFSGELGSDIASLEKYGNIIIDDFYKVSTSLENESLKMILSRNQGLCLTTTLYRGEKALQEFGLDNFKPIFYKVDETKAKEKITEYLRQNIEKEAKDKAIDKIVKHSKWSYPLDNNLWKVAGKEYSTYIPYWFVDAFLEFGESGLKLLTEEFLHEVSIEGIHSSFHDLAKKIEKSEIGKITKEFYREHLPFITDTLSVLQYAISSGLPIGAFAILRKIMGKKQEKVGEFRPFASLLQMRPQDIETIEKKLGCPPLTLFTIREFLKPGNLHKLHEAAEATKELKEKLDIFEKQHAEDLQKLDELETKWKEAENKLQQAEEITQCFKGINKTISDSIKEDIYPSFDTLGPLKRQGIIPQDAKIKIIERDEIAADIIKAIDAGKKLILIKGKGGVGKSSLMTFLAEKLKERGFFVGVPDVNKSKSFVELKLEQEKKRRGGSILLTEYGMKQTGNIIAGLEDSGLGFMINLLLSEKCTAVLMECRSEYTLSFKTAISKIRGLDIPCYEIELHGVEKMEDVVKQVFNTSKVTEQLEEIKRVSRANGSYNPFIAILAASWVDRGETFKGLSTNEFLEEFVDELFYKDKTQEVQKIFTLLSLCGGILKEDLRKCTSLLAPTGDLTTKWNKIKSIMESYSDGNSYVIKPDLISEVIFRNNVLPFFNDYLDMLANLEAVTDHPKHFDGYLFGVADNLGKAYKVGVNCTDQAYMFLKRAEGYRPYQYVHALYCLLGYFPIESSNISIENLIWYAEIEEEMLGDVVEPFVISDLAAIVWNNLGAGKEPMETLEKVGNLAERATKIISEISKKKSRQFDQEKYMATFYYESLSRFLCHQGHIKKEWVDHRDEVRKWKEFCDELGVDDAGRGKYHLGLVNPRVVLKMHFELFLDYVKSMKKINLNLFKKVVCAMYSAMEDKTLSERWKEEFRDVLEGY